MARFCTRSTSARERHPAGLDSGAFSWHLTAMDIQVKICGLSDDTAVRAALDGGASHIGFIFFPPSPRHVSIEAARALRAPARGRALAVAVTVDADDAQLDEIVSVMEPDVLQLHGKESLERVRAVKARYGLPVIKACSIRDAGDVDAALAYRSVADRLLLDAKAPAGSKLPGGNGVSFDWGLLATLDEGVDYMLSGGITIGNVDNALSVTHARALDVSSGVESAPGVKDAQLISQFLRTVDERGHGARSPAEVGQGSFS